MIENSDTEFSLMSAKTRASELWNAIFLPTTFERNKVCFWNSRTARLTQWWRWCYLKISQDICAKAATAKAYARSWLVAAVVEGFYSIYIANRGGKAHRSFGLFTRNCLQGCDFFSQFDRTLDVSLKKHDGKVLNPFRCKAIRASILSHQITKLH